MKLGLTFCLIALGLSACGSLWGDSPLGPLSSQASPNPPLNNYPPTLTPFQPEGFTPPPTVTATPLPGQPTNTPFVPSLYISSAVPASLRQSALSSGIPLASSPETANIQLDVANPQSTTIDEKSSLWFYALVAPFPTLVDDVPLADLRNAWSGIASGPFAGRPLWLDGSTLEAFSTLWGVPASGSVSVGSAETLVDSTWAASPAWAIVPFESLDPRWKVLTVDGQSPIHQEFNGDTYPLKVSFAVTSSAISLPSSNRDPDKLLSVIMTGTTALTRATADRMARNGPLYPGRDIRLVLRAADILHISNEVSFDPQCPTPNPWTSSFQFCSDPANIALFDDIGVDVVESTGNHIKDYGSQAFVDTIGMYKQHGWKYFGGGLDLQDAYSPALFDLKGTRLAFLGCNYPNPYGEWATDTGPGAAPCDFEHFQMAISELRAQGYQVIMTFQYSEYSQPNPTYQEQLDFRKMAEAGAVIVNGSQAHQPATMEFDQGSFIHYGLGNLFFDQMFSLENMQEFADRHVFYAGKYISTELLSFMLEDYARPRPMTEPERTQFLRYIFNAGGW